MKLENQQSTITNPQFSGGRPIGSGSYTGNTSFATASLAFAGIVNTTGSFRLIDTFGVSNAFFLTASTQTVANLNATQSVNGSTFYISISGSASAANKATAIASFLTVSASAIVQNVAAATTTLNVSSSINGVAGNNVYFTSGSANYNLGGGVGRSDYPYTFPFIAGGLYVGQIGDLSATTIDGSNLLFFSASGFIPGVFQSVAAYPTTTALGVIALK
jgi:hypothetical protein